MARSRCTRSQAVTLAHNAQYRSAVAAQCSGSATPTSAGEGRFKRTQQILHSEQQNAMRGCTTAKVCSIMMQTGLGLQSSNAGWPGVPPRSRPFLQARVMCSVVSPRTLVDLLARSGPQRRCVFATPSACAVRLVFVPSAV